MGACASVSAKDGAKAGFVPPLPAKEAAAATKPAAEQGEKKKGVLEDNNGRPSLGELLDEDEKRFKLEEAAPPPPGTKPKVAEEIEKKCEEKNN